MGTLQMGTLQMGTLQMGTRGSHGRQQADQRARDPGQVERRRGRGRSGSSGRTGAHEAAKLLFAGAVPVGGLPVKVERPELALGWISCSRGDGAHRVSGLVGPPGRLRRRRNPSCSVSPRLRPEPSPARSRPAPESLLLPPSNQARQPDAEPPRAEQVQEVPDVGRPAHRHHDVCLLLFEVTPRLGRPASPARPDRSCPRRARPRARARPDVRASRRGHQRGTTAARRFGHRGEPGQRLIVHLP